MSALVGAVDIKPVVAQESTVEEITVTGSRIRRQDFTANSPITTIDRSTFEETSTIGIETLLNRLPQFVPAATQFTTTDVQNTATNTVGASTVSLRGLGANRNLVLINGRRAQPVNASLVVDTNSIPASAIERVEVISGGASAVYGADAVGGVVNFILRDNFEGATIDARYGLTEEGTNEEYTISGLFGANVADGRGNIMFGIEHSSRDHAYARDFDWRVDQWRNPNILDLGAGSNFWVSETYIQSHSGFLNLPSQDAVDSVFPELAPGTLGRGESWYINPTPDGTGSVFTGAGWFGTASAPGAYKYDGPYEKPGYEGLPWRKQHPNGQITENAVDQWVSIPLDRYSIFGNATYEVARNTEAFIQGNFSRTRNETNLGFEGAALGGNNARVPYGDELYEPSLAEDGITTRPAYLPGGLHGLNCAPTGGCTESEAFPLPPEIRTLMDSRPNPNDDIRVNRNLDFLGGRRSFTQTTTFQVMAGLEGELDNGWAWDGHVSHGQTESVVNLRNFASLARWREVVGSPNFGKGFERTGNELGQGRAAGTATCTTGLPVIREFEVSQDCIKAMQANLQNNSQLEQNLAEINLTGNALELPAGPLQFAVGAAWRDYEYAFNTDNLTTNESFLETTLGLFPTSNTTGSFDVSEIYGELLIPLVSDVPGIQNLTLELGGRYSDFSSVGEVETFKTLFDWTITDWARLRGGWQLANRAPNLGELFLSRTQVFGSTNSVYGDQCSENSEEGPYSANPDVNVNGAQGAAFTKSLCEELMGSTAAFEYYENRPVEDQPTDGGTGLPNTVGNPNLESEEADTWTFGLVLNSPLDNAWLQGLSASIDYYEIEITDMIAVEGADPVFERCFNPDLNPDGNPQNSSCQQIIRDAQTGNVSAIDLRYTNEGRALTSGLDIQLNWNGDFRDLGFDAIPGGVSVNILANYNMENITQDSPSSQEIDWAGTQGCALQLQCMGYDYRIFSTFSYFNGPWNATLRWQHYPDIEADAYATNRNTDQVGVDSSYNIFFLSGGYQVNDRLMVRLGIENLFDKEPPREGGDPDAAGFPRAPTRAGGAIYDPLGRRFFLNATMSF